MKHSLPRLVPKQVITDMANEAIRLYERLPSGSDMRFVAQCELGTLADIAKRMRWTQLLYRINHALVGEQTKGGINDIAKISLTNSET